MAKTLTDVSSSINSFKHPGSLNSALERFLDLSHTSAVLWEFSVDLWLADSGLTRVSLEAHQIVHPLGLDRANGIRARLWDIFPSRMLPSSSWSRAIPAFYSALKITPSKYNVSQILHADY